MDDLQRLVAIEDIRRTKARYWNGVDLKDAPLMRSAFADGPVELDYRAGPDDPTGFYKTADDAVHALSSLLVHYASCHQGHQFEVDFVSDTEAKVVIAFADHYWFKGTDDSQLLPNGMRAFKSWGHYFETYRKSDKGWLIAAMTFRTIHAEIASQGHTP